MQNQSSPHNLATLQQRIAYQGSNHAEELVCISTTASVTGATFSPSRTLRLRCMDPFSGATNRQNHLLSSITSWTALTSLAFRDRAARSHDRGNLIPQILLGCELGIHSYQALGDHARGM